MSKFKENFKNLKTKLKNLGKFELILETVREREKQMKIWVHMHFQNICIFLAEKCVIIHTK